MFRAINRIIAVTMIMCLVFEQSGFAQIAPQMPIPAYINGYVAPDRFRPVQLRSISFDAAKQDFALYLDKGDETNAKPAQLSEAGKKLMQYFEIGLVMPNSYFWVNLRPDASDQIIDPNLGKTDIGQVLLEADLQLKKDMARFTSPNTKEGRAYWNKLYTKAEELFGQEDISVPTATRPWIVPGEILVRESNSSAYILKATLKVMLEQDYLIDAKNTFSDERVKMLNAYSSDIIRSEILPKLTREVNSSKKYAGMRQAYYSLILAQWFKAHYRGKDVRYASRIDKKVLDEGMTSQNPWSKNSYFQAYKKSFEQGEYNISETVQSAGGLTVRQYFSGGITYADLNIGIMAENSIVNGAVADPAVAALQVGLVESTPAGDIINNPQASNNDGGETGTISSSSAQANPKIPALAFLGGSTLILTLTSLFAYVNGNFPIAFTLFLGMVSTGGVGVLVHKTDITQGKDGGDLRDYIQAGVRRDAKNLIMFNLVLSSIAQMVSSVILFMSGDHLMLAFMLSGGTVATAGAALLVSGFDIAFKKGSVSGLTKKEIKNLIINEVVAPRAAYIVNAQNNLKAREAAVLLYASATALFIGWIVLNYHAMSPLIAVLAAGFGGLLAGLLTNYFPGYVNTMMALVGTVQHWIDVQKELRKPAYYNQELTKSAIMKLADEYRTTANKDGGTQRGAFDIDTRKALTAFDTIPALLWPAVAVMAYWNDNLLVVGMTSLLSIIYFSRIIVNVLGWGSISVRDVSNWAVKLERERALKIDPRDYILTDDDLEKTVADAYTRSIIKAFHALVTAGGEGVKIIEKDELEIVSRIKKSVPRTKVGDLKLNDFKSVYAVEVQDGGASFNVDVQKAEKLGMAVATVSWGAAVVAATWFTFTLAGYFPAILVMAAGLGVMFTIGAYSVDVITDKVVFPIMYGETETSYLKRFGEKKIVPVQPTDADIDNWIQKLSDNDKQVRWDAMVALGKSRSLRAVAPFIGLMNNSQSSYLVRSSLIDWLGVIGDKSAFDQLVATMLSDSNDFCRMNAAGALGRVHDPWPAMAFGPEVTGAIHDSRAIEPLLSALRNDKSSHVRRAAAFSLSEYADEMNESDRTEAIAELKEFVDDLRTNDYEYRQIGSWYEDAISKLQKGSSEAANRDGGTVTPAAKEMKELYGVLKANLSDPRSVSAADEGGSSTIEAAYIHNLQNVVQRTIRSREQYDEFMKYLFARVTQVQRSWDKIRVAYLATAVLVLGSLVVVPNVMTWAWIVAGYLVGSAGVIGYLYHKNTIESVYWKAYLAGSSNTLQFTHDVELLKPGFVRLNNGFQAPAQLVAETMEKLYKSFARDRGALGMLAEEVRFPGRTDLSIYRGELIGDGLLNENGTCDPDVRNILLSALDGAGLFDVKIKDPVAKDGGTDVTAEMQEAYEALKAKLKVIPDVRYDDKTHIYREKVDAIQAAVQDQFSTREQYEAFLKYLDQRQVNNDMRWGKIMLALSLGAGPLIVAMTSSLISTAVGATIFAGFAVFILGSILIKDMFNAGLTTLSQKVALAATRNTLRFKDDVKPLEEGNVRLNNGFQAPAALVGRIMDRLYEMRHRQPFDLVTLSRAIRFPDKTDRTILLGDAVASVIKYEDGAFDPVVRNIILSSLTNEGLRVQVMLPEAQDGGVRLVKLENGSTVAFTFAESVVMGMKYLQESMSSNDVKAFNELVRLARDAQYVIADQMDRWILLRRSLLEADGTMNDDVRNIVLTAVKGELPNVELVSPYAAGEDTTPVFIRAYGNQETSVADGGQIVWEEKRSNRKVHDGFELDWLETRAKTGDIRERIQAVKNIADSADPAAEDVLVQLVMYARSDLVKAYAVNGLLKRGVWNSSILDRFDLAQRSEFFNNVAASVLKSRNKSKHDGGASEVGKREGQTALLKIFDQSIKIASDDEYKRKYYDLDEKEVLDALINIEKMGTLVMPNNIAITVLHDLQHIVLQTPVLLNGAPVNRMVMRAHMVLVASRIISNNAIAFSKEMVQAMVPLFDIAYSTPDNAKQIGLQAAEFIVDQGEIDRIWLQEIISSGQVSSHGLYMVKTAARNMQERKKDGGNIKLDENTLKSITILRQKGYKDVTSMVRRFGNNSSRLLATVEALPMNAGKDGGLMSTDENIELKWLDMQPSIVVPGSRYQRKLDTIKMLGQTLDGLDALAKIVLSDDSGVVVRAHAVNAIVKMNDQRGIEILRNIPPDAIQSNFLKEVLAAALKPHANSGRDGGVISKAKKTAFIESLAAIDLYREQEKNQPLQDKLTKLQAAELYDVLIVPFAKQAKLLFDNRRPFVSEYPWYVATIEPKDNLLFYHRWWTYQSIKNWDTREYETLEGQEFGINAYSSYRGAEFYEGGPRATKLFRKLISVIPVRDNENFEIEVVAGDTTAKIIEKTIKVLTKVGLTNEGVNKLLDGGVAPKTTGGIDFRALPVESQPAVNAAAITQGLAGMPMVSAAELDKDWAGIQKQMAQGQMPYAELKKFVACCYGQKDAEKHLKAATQCVLNLLKLEEERAIATPDELKEIVVLM